VERESQQEKKGKIELQAGAAAGGGKFRSSELTERGIALKRDVEEKGKEERAKKHRHTLPRREPKLSP